MFNTTEHILHLYECIDELRDDIHELRYRTPPLPPFIEPYPPGFLTNNTRTSGRTGSNRTNSGLNWSVELENERSTGRRTGTGRVGSANRTGTRTGTGTRTRIGQLGVATGTGTGTGTGAASGTNAENRAGPYGNLNTPSNVELTFFEPRISSVRERLDSILNRIQREHDLTIGGLNPNTPEASTAARAVADNETRRLTLAEINTGCETKIYDGVEENCSICREPINGQSIVREIKNCRHKFHILCLDTWLENRRTCPICRGDIVLNSSASASASASGNTVVNDLD